MKDVLVVAFDGFDYDLAKKFGCKNLLDMKEVGSIDNETGMSRIHTEELFASFITGETKEVHGIKKYRQGPTTDYGLLPELFLPTKRMKKLPGMVALDRAYRSFFNFRNYQKKDFECDTIFEEISDSKDLFIPSYSTNSSYFARIGFALKEGLGLDAFKRDIDAEHEQRKKELFEELEKPHNFLMVHFHKPDIYQHLYTDYKAVQNWEEKLKPVYRYFDDLAAEVKSKADYETIVFMSDHGLPEAPEHNTKAFYASNEAIFQEKEPKITDFFDVVKERCDSGSELTGVEI
ncbi:MAG: alkaline phosphatase family protein [Candidatus Nanohaloarchaea archaeon]